MPETRHLIEFECGDECESKSYLWIGA